MAKKATAATIRDQIRVATMGAAPSMVPAPAPAPEVVPPPDKKEVHTSLSDLIADRKARLALARLVERHGILGQQISEMTKERDKLTLDIKNACGTHSISEADSGEWHISYYTMDRRSLNQKKLISLGVQPATILAATDVTTSYTLRVGKIKEQEDAGDL